MFRTGFTPMPGNFRIIHTENIFLIHWDLPKTSNIDLNISILPNNKLGFLNFTYYDKTDPYLKHDLNLSLTRTGETQLLLHALNLSGRYVSFQLTNLVNIDTIINTVQEMIALYVNHHSLLNEFYHPDQMMRFAKKFVSSIEQLLANPTATPETSITFFTNINTILSSELEECKAFITNATKPKII